MSKPSIPKGTRDFLPKQMVKRKYIFNTVEHVFKQHGFSPIETPSMEKTETLMGKYGDEGDRLIFKVLNSGEYMNKADQLIGEAFDFNNIFSFRRFKKIYNNNITNNINTEYFIELMILDFYENQNWGERDMNIFKDVFMKGVEGQFGVVVILFENFIRELKQKGTIKSDVEIVTFLKDISIKVTHLFKGGLSKKLTPLISEKALRYDLTVPFARFVVQNQNDLTFPFKRYQIQPVWRADRPQKGRYREFYQCDVDIVGSNSLYNELELIQIFDSVLSALKIPNFTIKINNRKVLAGIAEVMKCEDQLIDITVAIDKIDKIGIDKVIVELESKNIPEEAIAILKPILELKGSNEEMYQAVKNAIQSSETGMKGIEELDFMFSRIDKLNLSQANIVFDPSLARGLNYYTGAIFEVEANDVKIGSICGGGRYDDLTSIFGLKDLSGVGISFGADRIYDVLEELDLFPKEVETTTQLMFANFGEMEADFCLAQLSALRAAGVITELYPDKAKMKKQMSYAHDKNIPFVALIGSQEVEANKLRVKNMETGDQGDYSTTELIELLTK